jgi:hypothetical protein
MITVLLKLEHQINKKGKLWQIVDRNQQEDYAGFQQAKHLTELGGSYTEKISVKENG